MITTIQTLALQLARDIGITTFDTAAEVANRNLRGVTAQDKVAIVNAINGAYEELFMRAPAGLSESEVGGVLREPTSVTLTATQYSATISALTTYASWMIGCTIRVAGDANDNELTGSTTLARPFMGASGSGISATVHADAIPLDSTISHVLPPVSILGERCLRMATSREEFIESSGQGDYGGTILSQKPGGDPTVAFVDTRFLSTATQNLQKFIRFNRLPASAKSVRFRARLKPPSYTVANIGTDVASDPGVQMPLESMSSILFAFARKRISGDPLFGAMNAMGEIERQYKTAIAQLEASVPYIGPKNGQYH